MAKPINNYEDIIDSRDIIARIEDLQQDVDYLREELEGLGWKFVEHETGVTATGAVVLDRESMPQAIVAAAIAQDDDGSLYVLTEDEAEELALLLVVQDQLSGDSSWEHGMALVRDSCFEIYAQELAEEIGAVNASATWPNSCIDWEQAARDLKMDYKAVEFDGITYWAR